jgi:hypothetical protein
MQGQKWKANKKLKFPASPASLITLNSGSFPANRMIARSSLRGFYNTFLSLGQTAWRWEFSSLKRRFHTWFKVRFILLLQSAI